MNSQTGETTLNFPPQRSGEDRSKFHLSNDTATIDAKTGRVPVVKPYRVIHNATKAEVELSGAKLLQYVKEIVGSLEIGAVLMRFTFIAA